MDVAYLRDWILSQFPGATPTSSPASATTTVATTSTTFTTEECPAAGALDVLEPSVSRIVNGHEVANCGVPRQVELEVDGRRICGGSFVAPEDGSLANCGATVVITAAHCVDAASEDRVHFGQNNQSQLAANFIMHPSYTGFGFQVTTSQW